MCNSMGTEPQIKNQIFTVKNKQTEKYKKIELSRCRFSLKQGLFGAR